MLKLHPDRCFITVYNALRPFVPFYPKWEQAKRMFPKVDFPWDVFTKESLVESFKQLARSCAISAIPIPGMIFAIFASVLGCSVMVQAKVSWFEPLIFWLADIRPSGGGKTSMANLLMGVLHKLQEVVENIYQKRIQEELKKDKKDRKPVKKPKNYYMTNFTKEGIHNNISGNGGTILFLSEFSSFINSQNQYKAKGTDREDFIALWDGKPIRIVRKEISTLITNARVNIFGGIQPPIWKMMFGANKGLYLDDGTLTRILLTIEGFGNESLTEEAWTDESRKTWEDVLKKAIKWSEKRFEKGSEEPFSLPLDGESLRFFISWRNTIYGKRGYLPEELLGVIPKIVSYALRLTGIIYCINRFSYGLKIGDSLSLIDIKRGIEVAEFYLGHIIEAYHILYENNANITPNIVDKHKALALVFRKLESKVVDNFLPISIITNTYNGKVSINSKLTPRQMGELLKGCGLTKEKVKRSIHGKRNIYCLVWDYKTEIFIEQTL